MIGFTRAIPGLAPLCCLLLVGCGPSPDGAPGRSPDGPEAQQPEASAPTESAPDSSPLGLDRLYSLPRLIGTSPENYTWSADSSQLAFLWNDKALAFRDLWICTARDCTPSRLTRHGDETSAESLHGGISHALWRQPADQGLVYVLDGRLHAVDLEGRTQTIDPDLRHVQQLQIAPTGAFLSFVNGGPVDWRQFEFRPDGGLWIRASAPVGPAATRLVPTGHDAQYVESHQWSADGRSIAFVLADRQGMPEREIHYHLEGENRVRRVRRAFPGEETTSRRIGVADVASGEIRWLQRTDELRPIWGYGWSNDGTKLFVNESDFLIKEHHIEIHEPASGTRETFYHHVEPANVIPGWKVAWAPQDDGLLILTDRDGFYHLHHQRESGGPLSPLTSGPWEIESFDVDAVNGQIYFVANETHPSERQFYRVPLSGGEPERLSDRSGTHLPVYSPDFRFAAVRFSDDRTPPDLYLRALEADGKTQRITDSPLEAFESHSWAEVRYPTFKSLVDGTDLVGRLLLPADFDPSRQYPMIVGSIYPNTVRNNWGGGSATPIWGLDQHLVSRGYVVLTVDVRGSWGYGKAFSQGLLGDYGGIDTDDIESGVRHIVEQGFVDPGRIGIWGWSYGGLMTLMSLSRKPGLYAAGVADAPATNVWHAFPEQMWVMGERKGEDYPARYERLSAVYQTDGIQEPLMILHGTADAVVMYSDSIAFIEKLIAREYLFEFVPMPGTTHVWAEGNLARQRFGYRKIVEFFDRHLQP